MSNVLPSPYRSYVGPTLILIIKSGFSFRFRDLDIVIGGGRRYGCGVGDGSKESRLKGVSRLQRVGKM